MHDVRKYLATCLLGTAALLVGAAPAWAQTVPNLRTAANFAVLGGAGVTCTSSTIAGDVGSLLTVIPTATCAITGATHAGDSTAGTAYTDFVQAYAEADLNTCPSADASHNLSGDLGGLTLSPGVYCFSGVATLTSQLTLDGRGDANAVWIFKGTSITPINGSVVMANKGNGCNVYWRLGTTAAFDGTTAFVGNVLAGSAISFTGTGSSLAGRAMAMTAVTATGANITACAGAGPGPGPEPGHCSFTASPWIYAPQKACNGIVSAWDFSTGKPAPSLHLTKPCPTVTNAASGATLKGRGVKDITLTELNFDFQGYCGAGAPRFNVVTNDNVTHFLGCASATKTPLENGWTHAVLDPTNGLQAYPVITAGQTVRSIDLVFDEGTDNGADSGSVYLDNISVNNAVCGGPTPGQAKKMCKKGGFDNLTDANGKVFKNYRECDRFFKGLINHHHDKHHHHKHHHDKDDHDDEDHDEDDHDDGVDD